MLMHEQYHIIYKSEWHNHTANDYKITIME